MRHNCEFYIGDTKSTAAALKKMADEGTVYVKVTVNANGKVSKIIMSEDTFEENKKDTSKVYTVKSFTTKKMIVTLNGEETTYNFGSTNPVENIQFYKFAYDSDQSPKDGDWEELKNVNAAESFVDNADADDDTVYCKFVLNNSDKVTEIYLSAYARAWSVTSDEKTRAQGYSGFDSE